MTRECPFCRRQSSAFLPFGNDHPVYTALQVTEAGRRGNAICPVCHSLDRERLALLYLLKRRLIRRNTVLLHIAPERLLSLLLASCVNNYIRVDLDRQRPSLSAVMDITQLGFAPSQFDGIICNHVLEHVHHDITAMRELYRVLRPGGWAILQVPISQTLSVTYEDPSQVTADQRYLAYGQKDHVRVYGLDYRDRLESVGFQIEISRASQEFRLDVIERYSLIADESIFFVSKTRPESACQD